MPDAYFTKDESGVFMPTDFCRGPWDAQSCHAGPPTGLLVRAMERLLTADAAGQRLVRITVDLIRPVPMAGFSIRAEATRTGRSVSTLQASLVDRDGRERAVARGLALSAVDHPGMPTAATPPADLAAAVSGPFVFERTLHGLTCFTDSVQLRYGAGETSQPGPTMVWMNALPLLADEAPSPMQRICPLADCGNAFSRNAEPWDIGFMNADLTLVLHRPPAGEWFGSRSLSHWQPDGIGLARATLYDERGEVGEALQTLVLRPAR